MVHIYWSANGEISRGSISNRKSVPVQCFHLQSVVFTALNYTFEILVLLGWASSFGL